MFLGLRKINKIIHPFVRIIYHSINVISSAIFHKITIVIKLLNYDVRTPITRFYGTHVPKILHGSIVAIIIEPHYFRRKTDFEFVRKHISEDTTKKNRRNCVYSLISSQSFSRCMIHGNSLVFFTLPFPCQNPWCLCCLAISTFSKEKWTNRLILSH